MKKFFFVIWDDPKFYQTMIFLSQYLSKKNYKIYILYKKPNKKKDFIGNVSFGKNSKLIYYPFDFNIFSNLVNYLGFIIFSYLKFLTIKPENIVLFNRHALFSLFILKYFKKKGDKFFYHNFDFDNPKKYKSLKEKILYKLEFFICKYVDYLIFPSKNRGILFKKISKTKNLNVLSFENCFPKKFKYKTKYQFRKFLYKNKIYKKKIICRLGTIGPGHHLNEIIESVKYIKKDVILVLAGAVIKDFHKNLNEKINDLKLSNKIYIFTEISNSLWFEILYNSSIGLCFYEEKNLSHLNMAGTSSKFNNYLMANVPMIVNSNNDFLKYKKNFDIFETANPKKPKDIAKKISYILNNTTRYNKIKKNQKKTFLNYQNFEYQFKKSYDKALNY